MNGRERDAAAVPAMRQLLLMLVLAVLAGSAQAQERLLRLGVFAPERHVHVREVLAPWVDEVNAALEEEGIEIRLFAGGVLGRKGELQQRLLETGVHDLTWYPTGYMPGRFPGIALLEIPLLTEDPIKLTRAFWRLYERGAFPELDDVKPLALSVSPPYYFHLTFEMDSLDGLAGRKLRVLNAGQMELVRALDAVAIGGIGGTEVAESLSRGLIDGVLFSWHATRSMGVELVTRTHVDQPVAFSPSVLIMRRETFDALPRRAQQVIEARSGEALSVAYTRSMLIEAERARERIKADPRHHLYEPSESETARFEAAFEHLLERWSRDHPERQGLVDALASVLDELEAERRHADSGD